jgi:predicted RNA methylase
MMPKYENTKKFIEKASLRAVSEILDASDMIYRIHWATRQSEIDKTEQPAGLIPSVVVERHLALNWLTYYENNWDDVTCDT